MRVSIINASDFYKALFLPIEAKLGAIDPDTLVAVIGFDLGGPLNLCTIGALTGSPLVTYVTCELAVRSQQRPASIGRYELLCASNDQQWARAILTAIGRASFALDFDSGHTLDLGIMLPRGDSIQGVLFETEATASIGGGDFGILRVIGITRPELEYKLSFGTSALIERLVGAGVYPNTIVDRKSAV